MRPEGPRAVRASWAASAAIFAALLLAAPVAAQLDLDLMLPEPSAQDGPTRIRVEIGAPSGPGLPGPAAGGRVPGGRGAPDDPVPLSILAFGEMSPENPNWLTSSFIRVRIYSPWGFFPPYRVSGRLSSAPPSGPGDFAATDIGLGVYRVRARRPVINPSFDYDPRNAGKDVDDVPIFLGTLADLGTGLPRTELYHTNQYGRGRWNEIRLAFAVGPQYFTPTASETMILELAVELI